MDSPTTHDTLPSVPTGTGEELVIKQNQWCVVRTLFEQGLNKTAIASQLDLDLKCDQILRVNTLTRKQKIDEFNPSGGIS